MRSRRSAFRPDTRALAVAALLAVASACLADGSPTQKEIERALQQVEADPALATEQEIRTLRWRSSGPDEDPRKSGKRGTRPGWLEWLGDFFSWIAQASRLLMWVIIIGIVALIALAVARFVVVRRSAVSHTPRFFTPTHVRDLDIRPESLPDDIGAAARALWDGGSQRAALALLYRGLLSRLAHAHRVPIRDSSTEGDCLTLASAVLDAQRQSYATRLVRVWQSAIYGGQAIETTVVHELCAGFASHLDLRTGAHSRAALPA